MITFEEVEFTYGKNPVLRKINLSISAGEFVSVIGHNGSGKSTLAKHMNGLLVPTSGLVDVQGLSTANKDEAWRIKQLVGMVFQNPDNQFVAPTVFDDVAFGLENLGVPREEMVERIESALNHVGMWAERDREPHRLSGGQKQRVAIAGILAMMPKVVIFDESTAMLDPMGRREVLETALRLHQEGITVVNITHYPEEAVFSNRILVMNEGQIILQGQPSDIFQNIDQLHAVGLDVPFSVKLADQLRKKGLSLAPDVWKMDELVERLWTLL